MPDIAFYQDPSFIMAHDAPLPFNYVPHSGSMITFKTNGPDANAFYVKAKHHSNKVLLLFHEWWGLNDYIKQEAEHLQEELGDLDVMALDLFDGKVATTADEAGKLSSGTKPERIFGIIQGALSYIDTSKAIGTLGWCYGGGWALQAAFLAGARCKACVMYYGMPDTTYSSLQKLKAPVLGLFANKDKWITPEYVQAFAEAARKLGRSVEVKEYDADHAFANPSNPHFNKEAKEDADRRALAFLRAHM